MMRAQAVRGLAEEALAASPAPTVIVDDGVQVIWANGAARALLGRPGSDTDLLRCAPDGAGGCGRERPCGPCALRWAARQAMAGGAVQRAKVKIEVPGRAGAPELELLVSAARARHRGRDYAVLALEHAGGLAELRASRAQLRRLAARQETVREQEQARIARVLHDEMGQLLTALRLDVEALEEGVGALPVQGPVAALVQRAGDASQLVASLVETLHRMVGALRPTALDRLGLCPALREECRRFHQRTGVRCVVLVPDEPLGFGAEVDTALFRIAQEALANVARHAHASGVEVAVVPAGGRVELRVGDDGRGIDPSRAESSSLGIMAMRERTERLGGELTVGRGARGGTVVSASVPIAG